MRVRLGIARLKARESDRRKDWVEKTSTDLARRFDFIRVENLKIQNMTRSARGTLKAPGRRGTAKGRAQPGHSRLGLGIAGSSTGNQGDQSRGEGQPRVQ